jgi:hypothetical protein
MHLAAMTAINRRRARAMSRAPHGIDCARGIAKRERALRPASPYHPCSLLLLARREDERVD